MRKLDYCTRNKNQISDLNATAANFAKCRKAELLAAAAISSSAADSAKNKFPRQNLHLIDNKKLSTHNARLARQEEYGRVLV
jgi:hypothetical protein